MNAPPARSSICACLACLPRARSAPRSLRARSATRAVGTRTLAFVSALALALPAHAAVYWVTVAGLGGEEDYEQRFTGEARDVERVLKASDPSVHVQTLSGAQATREQLTGALKEVAQQAMPDDDFILLLIGHGSFDGASYKFNLPGPDISAAQLAALCNAIPTRRQLIINTTSSSGGSLLALQRGGRAVITATKSGSEKNATVFSRYWVEALQDTAADTDKSESISALEAFEYAARKTAEFYKSEKRIATEHPMFEDVGHGASVREVSTDPGSKSAEGRLLASITLVRLGQAREQAADPAKRDLLARKEKLLQQVDALKYQKAAMADADYQTQLKALLLDLARAQAQLDQ